MKKFWFILAFTLIGAIFALSVGASNVNNVWQIIFKPFQLTDTNEHQIIWQIRAPRVLAALLIGACLGIAGVLAQGSTNNPIADPAVLGTSAGAALGVVIGILLNIVSIGSIGSVIFAAIGALLATILTFSLARSALQLITIGIGISAILSALVGLSLAMVSRPDARSVSFWSFGSLALVTSNIFWILIPVFVLTALLAWKVAPEIDLLALGDSSARHIGIDAQRVRLKAFSLLAVLIAVTVSSVGSIAFLALAAPHIARYINGPRNRPLIIYAGAIGALILLAADTFARSILPPNELPIGLLTSLIGAPILIATLKKGGDVWR